LDCCGFEGPKEFAYNSEPIDDSCYDEVSGGNSGIASRRDDQSMAKKMKQVRFYVTFMVKASIYL